MTADMAIDLGSANNGSLLRSEARRITHRRLIRWLVLIGAVAYLGILAIIWTQHARTTPAELAKAQQRLDQMVAEQRVWWQHCQQSVPAGETAENYCGPAPTAENFGDVEGFLPRTPFTMAGDLVAVSLGLGALAACLCFLVAATAIGAEWSQKTLMALLFWEPRRLKVFATKVLVVALGTAGLALLAQALLIPIGLLFASVKGSTQTPPEFWSHLLAQQGRLALLAVLLGMIGFGVANLVRNTGAALGAGFVYLVLESVAHAVRPEWQSWFLTPNAIALVNEGGLSVGWETREPVLGPDGALNTYKEVLLTNLHGGLVIGSVALVLLALGGWSFKRRDLT